MKTGRKFKCIGLKETVITDWNSNYTIDKVYAEATDKLELTDDLNKMLFLMGDFNRNFCVDVDQFELIKN